MSERSATPLPSHTHTFLGDGHEQAERRTWAVIALCSVMMVVEVVGGIAYGSIALTADGLHMFTHAGALLLAALAYRMARRRANDARFSFGTGKIGDLAGFTSAIVLAMIAVLIGYEATMRAVNPVPIDFDQALVIAVLGLLVNISSVWLLGHGSMDTTTATVITTRLSQATGLSCPVPAFFHFICITPVKVFCSRPVVAEPRSRCRLPNWFPQPPWVEIV